MRVLVGGELGQNAGHTSVIVAIADFLQAAGHAVTVAIPERFRPSLRLTSDRLFEVVSAPDWQSGASGTSPQHRQSAKSMGDVLDEVGFFKYETLVRVISDWCAILSAGKFDVLIAEYAPALLMAADGRVPRISFGTGFTCPPAHLSRFPALSKRVDRGNEAIWLETVNRARHITGLCRLASLPAMFRAEEELLATFSALDPYATLRLQPRYVSPSAAPRLFEISARSGGGVFVYSYNAVPPHSRFWLAIAATQLPTDVHMLGPSPEHAATFSKLGFALHSSPLDFERIAERTAVVVSHGGHGTICSALLAGLPIMTAYLDLEKRLNGEAVTRLGVGRSRALGGSLPIDLAIDTYSLATDPATAERSRDLACSLRSSGSVSYVQRIEEAVARLCA